MKSFEEHLIREDASIIEAMKRLNEIPLNLTLFVLDGNERMVGTLTDGDVRRGFIRGLTLDTQVSAFMTRHFDYLNGRKCDVHEIKKIRQKGVQLLPVLNDEQCIVGAHDLKRLRAVLPLDCMIMAGGRGERLRPLTDDVPKPLLKVGGKPIIEHNIDRLISYGIQRICISVRYLGQQLVDYFGDGSSKGIRIDYVWEDKPLGTAGALALVPDFQTDYVLIMNSDLFTDADFEDLYVQVIDNNAAMGIASIPYTVNIPYAILAANSKEVYDFKEKPSFTDYANAGIYLLKRDLIKEIPTNTRSDITDLIRIMIRTKERIIHNPIIGYWIDVGTHDEYKKANEIAGHLASSSK